jgi:hypothetical protein
MKFKKIISLLLLLTLILQVLPVEQLGAILFNNQINEELSHETEGFKDGSKKSILQKDYLSYSSHSNNLSDYSTNSNTFIFYVSDIPSNHALEILIPPPNIA